MSWDVYKAKRYLLGVASDLIQDGIFAAEGGRLIYEVKFAGGCDTQQRFIQIIQHILEWDLETIAEALAKLKE